jgi:hypothetical protein
MTSSRLRRISVCLLAACFALSAPLVSACGKERWSVKTVTDKDAAKVQEAPTPGHDQPASADCSTNQS